MFCVSIIPTIMMDTFLVNKFNSNGQAGFSTYLDFLILKNGKVAFITYFANSTPTIIKFQI